MQLLYDNRVLLDKIDIRWKNVFWDISDISSYSPLGRSENQKNQKINNGECFFCVLVYKEQGKLQLV